MKDYRFKKPTGCPLKSWEISQDLLEAAVSWLATLKSFRTIQSRDEFNRKTVGRVGALEAFWNGHDALIVRELTIQKALEECGYEGIWECRNAYYAGVFHLNPNLPKETLRGDISGGAAKRAFVKLISKRYSPAEIEAQLESKTAEYDESKKQMHILPSQTAYCLNRIAKLPNCVEWDINGAHCDALREIFPESAPEIEKLYEERKKKPNNKKIPNFYVGMLARDGHRKTYNWIVQRTTSILERKIEEQKKLGAKVIYANTDGAILQYPKGFDISSLKGSKKLGGFKIEHAGDCYAYQKFEFGCCYWAIEMDGEIKGSLPLQLRDRMSLKDGKTVSYRKKTAVANGARITEIADVEENSETTKKEELN